MTGHYVPALDGAISQVESVIKGKAAKASGLSIS